MAVMVQQGNSMCIDSGSIAEIRQMQYEIDECHNFINHIFLLLTADPNRKILAGGSEMESMMNEIVVKLDEVLIDAGKKSYDK
jgi:hypothetical protein